MTADAAVLWVQINEKRILEDILSGNSESDTQEELEETVEEGV